MESNKELVPSRRLNVERVTEAGRQDARAADIRNDVDALASKASQLYQLQFHAAQYQKAYVDERIGSATMEARSHAEALGLAVTQVHSEQIVLKEHLGAHLQAVDSHLRQQLDKLNENLSHRQFMAIQAIDRRMDELGEYTKGNADKILAMQAGQNEAWATYQQGIQQRFDDLEKSVVRAPQCQDLERRIKQRVDELVATYQLDHRNSAAALNKLDDRLTARINKAIETKAAIEATQTRRSPAFEALKEKVQLQLSELSTLTSTAIEDAEARVTARVKSEVANLASTAAVHALEEKIAKQDHEAVAVQATSLVAIRDLQQRLELQDAEIRQLRAQLDRDPPRAKIGMEINESVRGWFRHSANNCDAESSKSEPVAPLPRAYNGGIQEHDGISLSYSNLRRLARLPRNADPTESTRTIPGRVTPLPTPARTSISAASQPEHSPRHLSDEEWIVAETVASNSEAGGSGSEDERITVGRATPQQAAETPPRTPRVHNRHVGRPIERYERESGELQHARVETRSAAARARAREQQTASRQPPSPPSNSEAGGSGSEDERITVGRATLPRAAGTPSRAPPVRTRHFDQPTERRESKERQHNTVETRNVTAKGRARAKQNIPSTHGTPTPAPKPTGPRSGSASELEAARVAAQRAVAARATGRGDQILASSTRPRLERARELAQRRVDKMARRQGEL